MPHFGSKCLQICLQIFATIYYKMRQNATFKVFFFTESEPILLKKQR